MIDFDEIRKQVAIKHNVLIGKDDPILITVTINDIVLGRHLELISEHYEETNKAMMVNLQQQVEQSKEIAGRIITDAANYISEQVQQAATATINQLKNDLQVQITKAETACHRVMVGSNKAQTAKKSAYVAAALAGMAAVVAITVLLIIITK